MDITTVKLRKRTKFLLDRMKNAHESYDSVILRLVVSNTEDLKSKLIKGYKQSAKRDKELIMEWDIASTEVPDE